MASPISEAETGAPIGDERSDLELMKRIADGDRAAFHALYQRFERRVYFFIERRIRDRAASEDVFHETMLEVWRGAAKFEGRSKPATWIFGVAHNKSVDYLRKKRPETVAELDETIADEGESGFEAAAAASDAAALKICMDKLPPAMADAIRLVFYGALRYGEVAETLGCAEGTVKARIHHAKKSLLACLGGLGMSRES